MLLRVVCSVVVGLWATAAYSQVAGTGTISLQCQVTNEQPVRYVIDLNTGVLETKDGVKHFIEINDQTFYTRNPFLAMNLGGQPLYVGIRIDRVSGNYELKMITDTERKTLKGKCTQTPVGRPLSNGKMF